MIKSTKLLKWTKKPNRLILSKLKGYLLKVELQAIHSFSRNASPVVYSEGSLYLQITFEYTKTTQLKLQNLWPQSGHTRKIDIYNFKKSIIRILLGSKKFGRLIYLIFIAVSALWVRLLVYCSSYGAPYTRGNGSKLLYQWNPFLALHGLNDQLFVLYGYQCSLDIVLAESVNCISPRTS